MGFFNSLKRLFGQRETPIELPSDEKRRIVKEWPAPQDNEWSELVREGEADCPFHAPLLLDCEQSDRRIVYEQVGNDEIKVWREYSVYTWECPTCKMRSKRHVDKVIHYR